MWSYGIILKNKPDLENNIMKVLDKLLKNSGFILIRFLNLLTLLLKEKNHIKDYGLSVFNRS